MSAIFQTRAPVRIDLGGGGTDCPPYCIDHGGAVTNLCIQRHARATLEPGDGPEVCLVSRDFDQTVRAGSIQELRLDGELDLIKGLVRRMNPPWGFRITVESEAPPGSGLGSSGAVGVAIVRAFEQALGLDTDADRTAALANDVERNDLGMAGGNQDSFGPAHGGFNLFSYHPGGGMDHRKLAVPDAARRELEARAVLVYTGHAHVSSNIHVDIKASYALPDSPTVDAMHHLKRIGIAMATALEAGAIDRCGELLAENWIHHKRLHPSCTNEHLEAFYAEAGPLITGGKTCGAGGGGCILFIARPGKQEELESACRKLDGELLPFKLDDRGLV